MAVLHRVAHRGYSAVAPENTLPALAAGVLAGATFIEFDVRTSADGVPVVIHDRTLERTTNGTGHVWERTAAELTALDAGSWFSPAYAGTPVPTLVQALDLLRPYAEIELLVEIKPPASLEQVRAILGLVAERDLLARTVVQSFDPEVVQRAGEAVPDVRRGLLREPFDADQVAVAKELGVAFCNPSVADVLAEPGTVAALADVGVAVMAWTANDPAQWPGLVAAGVSGVITDRLGELTGWATRAFPG
ncbi:glycerophosphodiester phosphodiesterase [Krasilnikovia sp. MM14-A1259]|uniref:glycerophosphodiester phosphodiesterase n=1 Tax=Krasilnikovia sp. MM14-A1259 TaxID=3373539 RepID=UPI00382E1A71